MAASSPTMSSPTEVSAGRREQGRPWLWFLLPFLVPFVLFYVVPIGYAIYQSLFRIQRSGGSSGPRNRCSPG